MLPLARAKTFLRGEGGLSVHLSAITAVQILVSFGIQLYTVTCFGAGRETDALYTGLTLPLALTVLVIETFTVVVIPLLTSESEEELRKLGWQLFFGSAGFFLLVCALLFVLAPLFVPLLVPGFTEAQKHLTVQMTRIQVWVLVGNGCYAVLSALYQVRNRFVWALLSQLLASIAGAFLLVWKLKSFGIMFGAWMQLLIATVPVILLLPILGTLPGQVGWRVEFFKKIWQNMKPMLMGKAYFMINAPIDRVLASHLAPGTIVIFELVGRFYNAILRILNKGIVMPTLPPLSRLAQEGKWEKFWHLYRRKAWQMGAVGLVIILAIIGVVTLGRIFAGPLHLVAITGKLSTENLSVLWLITLLMAAVLPSTCIANVQGNAFFAQRDTATPTRIGVVFCTIGFGTKIAGFFLAGIKGVVLAGTFGAIATAVVNEVVLQRRIDRKIRHDEVSASAISLKPLTPLISEPVSSVEGS
jgi:putative peptidoglycan lipid II flippase